MKKLAIMALVLLMAACSSKSKEQIGTATEGEARALKAISELSVNPNAFQSALGNGISFSTMTNTSPQSSTGTLDLSEFDTSIGNNGQFNYTSFDSSNGYAYTKSASGSVIIFNGYDQSQYEDGGIQFLSIKYPTKPYDLSNFKYTVSAYHLPNAHFIVANNQSFKVTDSNGDVVNRISNVQLGSEDTMCNLNISSFDIDNSSIELSFQACKFIISAQDGDNTHMFTGTVPAFKLKINIALNDLSVSGPTANIEGPIYNGVGERIGFFKLDKSTRRIVLMDNNKNPF
jgi:hypothetical protein